MRAVRGGDDVEKRGTRILILFFKFLRFSSKQDNIGAIIYCYTNYCQFLWWVLDRDYLFPLYFKGRQPLFFSSFGACSNRQDNYFGNQLNYLRLACGCVTIPLLVTTYCCYTLKVFNQSIQRSKYIHIKLYNAIYIFILYIIL